MFSGPGVLAGVALGDWLRLLRRNRWAVDWPYWPRACFISFSAALNSLVGAYEQWRYEHGLESVAVAPPVFVIGHWRSGTTLLHDLLAVDRRFACPNLYEVTYPRTFLTTERLQAGFMRLLLPRRRPQDNMRFDPAVPWEDEFVMCARGFRTPYLLWAFPRAESFERFLTFREASADEVAEWRTVLLWFLRKLTLKYRRPLILKSPTHTGRIRLLLEIFPTARFVHIYRNPCTVYQSTRLLYEKALPLCLLQGTDGIDWEDRIIRQYQRLYAAYFEEREVVPSGQLHEVCFEDLEKDPVGQVRILYDRLSLPDFAEAEPELRQYVASLAGYQKNVFGELEPAQRERLAAAWWRSFQEWNYPR